ncbi:phage/plasmid replication protein, II/X family, partial [Acinetobacter baumannii]
SYVRAYNALDFYRSLRTDGWVKVKARHCKSRFYKRKDDLLECGIALSHLQNLHKNPNGKVIPFVRLFELKMADQLPPDYVQPVSQYSPKNQGLHLVA